MCDGNCGDNCSCIKDPRVEVSFEDQLIEQLVTMNQQLKRIANTLDSSENGRKVL